MQKMSEKDAIFVLKRTEAHGPLPIMAKEVAIQALEEIQQYRATGMTPEQIKEMQMDYCAKGAVLEEYKEIGTVKEIKIREASAKVLSERYLSDLGTLREYQEIGTIEELRADKAQMMLKKYGSFSEMIDAVAAYSVIGTVDKCREAVERMKPKKPIKEDSGCYDYDFDYKCPTCGEYIDDTTCCGKCGQAIDWEE